MREGAPGQVFQHHFHPEMKEGEPGHDCWGNSTQVQSNWRLLHPRGAFCCPGAPRLVSGVTTNASGCYHTTVQQFPHCLSPRAGLHLPGRHHRICPTAPLAKETVRRWCLDALSLTFSFISASLFTQKIISGLKQSTFDFQRDGKRSDLMLLSCKEQADLCPLFGMKTS